MEGLTWWEAGPRSLGDEVPEAEAKCEISVHFLTFSCIKSLKTIGERVSRRRTPRRLAPKVRPSRPHRLRRNRRALRRDTFMTLFRTIS